MARKYIFCRFHARACLYRPLYPAVYASQMHAGCVMLTVGTMTEYDHGSHITWNSRSLLRSMFTWVMASAVGTHHQLTARLLASLSIRCFRFSCFFCSFVCLSERGRSYGATQHPSPSSWYFFLRSTFFFSFSLFCFNIVVSSLGF